MSKFGALAANVSEAFKVEIIDPLTDEVIKDKDGKVAYVEVGSTDSDEARKFDKARRAVFTRRAIRGRNQEIIEDDQLEENIAKLARLTKSWHLVDPATQEVIDVPCNEANALELYSEPGTTYIYRQVWVGASGTANFIKRSPKS
jgi:hypothetical protein